MTRLAAACYGYYLCASSSYYRLWSIAGVVSFDLRPLVVQDCCDFYQWCSARVDFNFFVIWATGLIWSCRVKSLSWRYLFWNFDWYVRARNRSPRGQGIGSIAVHREADYLSIGTPKTVIVERLRVVECALIFKTALVGSASFKTVCLSYVGRFSSREDVRNWYTFSFRQL